ncbi:MAG: hypothetical protein NC343_02480 [Muribaculum sp.]|nr:hypothetical protein [Muribaculaceae bacterium]MCM1080592.1 hypothetical protein [Muribaculum sp.]
MRKLLSMPGYTLTAIVTLAILYLTLIPKPLPDLEPELFEGADKVVHGLMFLGFAGAVGLDYLRSSAGERYLSAPFSHILLFVVLSIAFGGLVELAQGAMKIGRGEDIYDFLADAIGAVLAGIIMIASWAPIHRWWWQAR